MALASVRHSVQQAPLPASSTVKTAVEGKTESILNSCLNSVVFLPLELGILKEEEDLCAEVCAG